MSAQQDITVGPLQPGETSRIQRTGEFVYLKFAEQPLDVVMEGTRTQMVAGDKRRVRGAQTFESLEVTNAGDFPSSFVLVVGYGDFDRVIVQGEINVRPSIRGADGVLRSDTRRDIGLSVDIDPADLVLNKGRTVEEPAFFPDNAVGIEVTKDYILASINNFSAKVFNRRTGALVKNLSNTSKSTETWGVAVDTLRDRVLNLLFNAGTGAREIEVYQFERGWDWIETIALPDYAVDLAYLADRREIAIRNDDFNENGEIVVLDSLTYQELRRSDALALADGGIAYLNGELYLFQTGSNTFQRRDPVNFDLIATETITGAAAHGAAAEADFQRFYIAEANDDLVRLVPQNVTFPGSGEAVLDGCGVAGVLDANRVNTTADITFERNSEGRVVAIGEFIRAVLDFYFGYGKLSPPDYLDHVYAIRLPDGRSVSTGYESFKAAGQADFFSVEVPGRVVLTVDDSI